MPDYSESFVPKARQGRWLTDDSQKVREHHPLLSLVPGIDRLGNGNFAVYHSIQKPYSRAVLSLGSGNMLAGLCFLVDA